MKQITIGVWIALAVILTNKISLQHTYQEVKQDIENEGYDFGYIWYEDVSFGDIGRAYGMNPSMGALVSNITILVNYEEWLQMNKTQRKLLLLHEIIHSVGKEYKYHCSDRDCIMSSGHIDRWKNADFKEVMRYTLQHHHLLEQDRKFVLRF